MYFLSCVEIKTIFIIIIIIIIIMAKGFYSLSRKGMLTIFQFSRWPAVFELFSTIIITTRRPWQG